MARYDSHNEGMEIPTINPQDISAFHSLHDEFKRLQAQASDEISVARQNSANELTISRNGELVVVPEGALWDEVFYIGRNSDAGKILAEKYPKAFELSAKAEQKSAELKAFAMSKWGIDPLAMSLSDIIRIIEGLIASKGV